MVLIMSLNNFKNEIESILMITEWNPTTEQLRSIAREIKLLGSSPNKAEIERVVLNVVGSYESICLEGLDHSDLSALLLMATRVQNNNDK